jgi:hypothetical protein
MYASGGICQLPDIRQQLSDCANSVDRWCDSRRLRLNGNKSEVIWFASKSNLAKLSGEQLTVSIGLDTVDPLHVVRDLGVQLDDELSMKQHVNLVSRTCFHLLRRLRQVRVSLVRISLCGWWSRSSCHGSTSVILCSPACQRLQLLRYKESRTQLLEKTSQFTASCKDSKIATRELDL